MKCTECDFEYGVRKEDLNFCSKCGTKLPELSQLSQEAWRRVAFANVLGVLAVFISPGILGAGIALWFMAPVWFDFTETNTIRAISIGLMVSGPSFFILAIAYWIWTEDRAVQLSKESSHTRPTNIYLLLDVSKSMGDKKLQSAKEASESFLSQMDEEHDRLGLISFSDKVNDLYPLGPIDKTSFGSVIYALTTNGKSALYDAVIHAVKRAKEHWDPERNNIIIAMTDGRDDVSKRGVADIEALLADEEKPIFMFTVAYGWSANRTALREIAESGGGQVFSANERTIKKLYRLLPAFF